MNQIHKSHYVFASAICLLFVCFFALSPSWSAKDKSELYAVVIGVGKYQDPEIPELNLAHKDAKDFHKLLMENSGLFSKTHICPVLINENATRANVVKALRDFLRPAGKDDLVIIYLSGHGAADPSNPDEFYFCTYDSKWDNLYGTALLMTDGNLFRHIDSEKVLLIADACHSGGFVSGIEKSRAKSIQRLGGMFDNMQGRIALLSSKPDQSSYEEPRFGNSVFTHFLLRAFRGEADSGDGAITARDLYEFVYNSTKDATQGKQHPQMYSAKGRKDPTIVFKAAKFADTLNIKGQFFYEDDNGRVRPLNPGDTLQSGQKVGISFESESDCFVYIFWWDTNGKVGQLFPNPELTEGTGEVKAGRTYWLPSLRGDRWYMLDLSPGTETLYFVASREKNPDIEQLSGKLLNAKGSQANRAIGQQLEHNFNLMSPIKVMGFSQQTAEKKGVGRAEASYDDKTSLFKDIEESVKVRGKDAQYKIEFTHK